MTIEKISKLVKSTPVHQIRSGVKHRFIDITIVEVNGRFFVRQYKFGKDSWYHAFSKTPQGEMTIKGITIAIEGSVPKDLNDINPKVTRAFHKKLPIVYLIMKLRFDTKKHEASTLELIPIL